MKILLIIAIIVVLAMTLHRWGGAQTMVDGNMPRPYRPE